MNVIFGDLPKYMKIKRRWEKMEFLMPMDRMFSDNDVLSLSLKTFGVKFLTRVSL
jgi:hypothetical protein